MGRKGSSQRAEGKSGHKVEGETQNIIQMHGSAAVRKLIKKLKRLTAAILISIKNFRRDQEKLEKRKQNNTMNQTNKQKSPHSHTVQVSSGNPPIFEHSSEHTHKETIKVRGRITEKRQVELSSGQRMSCVFTHQSQKTL